MWPHPSSLPCPLCDLLLLSALLPCWLAEPAHAKRTLDNRVDLDVNIFLDGSAICVINEHQLAVFVNINLAMPSELDKSRRLH